MENSIAGFQRQKDNRKPTVFHQLSKLISVGMLRNLAKKYEVDDKSRTSLPWSHVVSLLYCQLTLHWPERLRLLWALSLPALWRSTGGPLGCLRFTTSRCFRSIARALVIPSRRAALPATITSLRSALILTTTVTTATLRRLLHWPFAQCSS